MLMSLGLEVIIGFDFLSLVGWVVKRIFFTVLGWFWFLQIWMAEFHMGLNMLCSADFGFPDFGGMSCVGVRIVRV